MKKIALFVLLVSVSPVFANDFYFEEYVAPDADAVPETSVPVISADGPVVRDNYVGLRLHKNERISYSFDRNSGGGTTLKDDGLGFGGYVGNRLTEFLKIEFETIYTGVDDSRYDLDFNFDIWANMINTYLYHMYGGAVEPYIALGLGLSTIWSDISGWGNSATDTTFDFSYSFMVGVNFALNNRVDLNLGFKYQKYGDVGHNNSVGTYATTDIDATEFYLGMAYKFGLE